MCAGVPSWLSKRAPLKFTPVEAPSVESSDATMFIIIDIEEFLAFLCGPRPSVISSSSSQIWKRRHSHEAMPAAAEYKVFHRQRSPYDEKSRPIARLRILTGANYASESLTQSTRTPPFLMCSM
ncbi:hypothetical protein LshimejAT787_1402490 [Lyophyllum shimeji]|uniref:Uncharacterized protein n=1 Tax=Lyophyllum shimeji TaxID=47721 RepID=A0A9P3UT16_LYOSH|nr:hypothetical protein LshimejAT787_1402490 [Lyophyllum shimeji]